MQRYLIVLPLNSTVDASKIESVFAENQHAIVPDRVWVVATTRQTCGDVAKDIGIGPTQGAGNIHSGAVFRITDYDGFAPQSLWEKLYTWQTSS